VWLEQIVQLGRPGAFFERDLQVYAQPVDKLQNHAGLRLDDTLHHDLPCSIPNRNRNAFHVNSHADILCAER
jgi:hypothetical protein